MIRKLETLTEREKKKLYQGESGEFLTIITR